METEPLRGQEDLTKEGGYRCGPASFYLPGASAGEGTWVRPPRHCSFPPPGGSPWGELCLLLSPSDEKPGKAEGSGVPTPCLSLRLEAGSLQTETALVTQG